MSRFAQVPPPPPPAAMPPAMPAPMGGMPPMPPAMAAPTANTPRQELVGPLDSVSKVLYDYDIGTAVDGNAARDAEDLALEVWKTYGGTDIGDGIESKSGERTDNSVKQSPEQQETEQKNTDDSRWKRLPKGKTIEDITSLEELSDILSGLVMGAVKSKAAPPAPPGGMMPPMASVVSLLHRYAKIAESRGSYGVADQLDSILKELS